MESRLAVNALLLLCKNKSQEYAQEITTSQLVLWVEKAAKALAGSFDELGSFASLPKSENPSVWRMTITIKDTNRTEEYWPSTKLLGFKVGRFLILDRQFVSVFANSRDYNS